MPQTQFEVCFIILKVYQHRILFPFLQYLQKMKENKENKQFVSTILMRNKAPTLDTVAASETQSFKRPGKIVIKILNLHRILKMRITIKILQQKNIDDTHDL